MKIGVKTYDNKNFIEHFSKIVDMVEVMGLSPEEFLKNKEIIIHGKHDKFGFNLADKTKEKENLETIKLAIDIADFCNSGRIVVHPGTTINENCSIENSLAILKKLNDKRIVIENMPQNYGDKPFLCSTPEETKSLLEKTSLGFCFDINHAISSAVTRNLEPYAFIDDFIKLKPTQIHLGGHKLPEDITHLSLTESNIDLKRVLKALPENSEIILEVTQDIKKTEEDIKLLKNIWKETH